MPQPIQVKTSHTPLVRVRSRNKTSGGYLFPTNTHSLVGADGLPKDGLVRQNGRRTLAEIIVIGDAANNAVIPTAVYTIDAVQSESDDRTILHLVRPILTAPWTFGALMGPSAGAAIDSDERAADTIGALSKSVYGAAIESMYRSEWVASSPANDTTASLGIIDIGDHDFIFIDHDLTNTTGVVRSVNSLVRMSN